MGDAAADLLPHSQLSASLSPTDRRDLDKLRLAADEFLRTIDGAEGDRMVKYIRAGEARADATFLTFLEDNRLKVEAALKAFQHCINWRINAEFTKEKYEKQHLKMLGKIPIHFTGGCSHDGQPVVYAPGKDVIAKNIQMEDVNKFGVPFMDGLFYSEEAASRAGTCCVILDLEGFSLTKNFSVALMRSAFELIQDIYPRRMGKILVVKYPAPAKYAFNVLYPFMSEYLRQCILFVEPDKIQETIGKYVPDASVPVHLGGKWEVPR